MEFSSNKDTFLLKYFVELSFEHSNKMEALNKNNIYCLSELIVLNPDNITSNFKGFGWTFIKKMQREFNRFNLYFGMDKAEFISVVNTSEELEIIYNQQNTKNSSSFHTDNDEIFSVPNIFDNLKVMNLMPFLRNIPDESKLKFRSSVLSSFANHFHTIGSIKENIEDKVDLMTIDGLGRKKIDLIYIFLSNYFTDFNQLFDFLNDNNVVQFKDLNYSYNLNSFLLKNQINTVDELKEFVIENDLNARSYSFEEDKFSELELLALLELLTFQAESNGIYSSVLITEKKLSLDKCVDFYFDKLIVKQNLKDIANFKFEFNYTLNETGEELGITRERARQIVRKFCEDFNLIFLFSFKDVNKSLFDECLAENAPIDLNFSCFNQDNDKLFSEKFYLNFLSYFFNSEARRKYSKDTINIGPPFKNTIDDIGHPIIYKLPDFCLKIEDLIDENDGYQAVVSIMYHLFPEERNYLNNLDLNYEFGTHPILKIFEKEFDLDSQGYIYRVSNNKSRTKMVQYVFKCFNSTALHIDKIGSILLSNDIFDFRVEDIFREKSPIHGEGYDNAIYTDCQRIDEIFMFGHQVFGTKNCFSCTFEEWREIRNLSYNLIEDTGHELSAFEIFAYVKQFVKNLSNKYELVCILRDDNGYLDFENNKLKYIHPFRFTLSNLSHKSKTVKDIMIDILKESSRPMLGKELHKLINKKRSYRIEGMPIMAKQTKQLKLYGGAYFGLAVNDEQNINYLSTDLRFIKSLLTYSFAHEVCYLDDFIDSISYGGSEQDFKRLVQDDQNIKIIPTSFDNFEDNQIILMVLKSNVVNNIKKIIKSFDVPLSWIDIEYILSDYLDLNVINPKNRREVKSYKIGSRKVSIENIEKELNEDLSIVYKNGKYSSRKLDKNDFTDVLDECFNILNEEKQQFDIEDLHRDIGLNNIKINELLFLLSSDKRFSIISNREIYLTSWV